MKDLCSNFEDIVFEMCSFCVQPEKYTQGNQFSRIRCYSLSIFMSDNFQLSGIILFLPTFSMFLFLLRKK